MRKAMKFVVAGCALAILPLGAANPTVAEAAPGVATAVPMAKSKSKKAVYKNCTALNKKYKHGVKKSSSTKDVVRSNGKTTKKASKAKVSKALYKANKHLDRDKDGIACEA